MGVPSQRYVLGVGAPVPYCGSYVGGQMEGN